MISVAKANLEEDIAQRHPHEMPTRSQASEGVDVFNTEDEVEQKNV